MKKYIKDIAYLLTVGFSAFAVTSCSEDTMDKINKNDNHPLTANAKFVVTDLETSTAFSVVGGDFSLYASIYMEHEAGISNQTYNAEMRLGEPSSTTTYNNVWNSLYTNIKNAKVVIEKCSEGGPEVGSDITLGIGKVFLAYNGAVLADLFGDAPYFEAGVLDEVGLPVYRQSKVDKQQDIYKDVLKLIDEAIVLFDGEDAGVLGDVGTQDLIFTGDGESWKKVAYGLKARYTMRLLATSSNKTQDLNNILSYIDNSFTSADEEFKFTSYDGGNNNNPLAAFSYSREALAASKSLFDKFIERKDPRTLPIIRSANGREGYRGGNPITDIANAYLVPNGDAKEQLRTYSYLATDYSWSAPTQLMSYHELLFLKAEALARLNKTVEAESALKEAIGAGFDNLSYSLADAGVKADLSKSVDSYFTDNVKPLFTANPLKEIMIQKYLSFVGASGESVEAYNDYRRMQALGESFIKLENPKNTTSFPLRFTYGNSDVLANPNVTSLVSDRNYVYTEKVWWAGGTR